MYNAVAFRMYNIYNVVQPLHLENIFLQLERKACSSYVVTSSFPLHPPLPSYGFASSGYFIRAKSQHVVLCIWPLPLSFSISALYCVFPPFVYCFDSLLISFSAYFLFSKLFSKKILFHHYNYSKYFNPC